MEQQAMNTNVSSGIDKVLFVLFFILYVTVIVITSAVLTGCTSDELTAGTTTEKAQQIGNNGNQQDAKLGSESKMGEVQASVIDSTDTIDKVDVSEEDSSNNDDDDAIGVDSADSEDADTTKIFASDAITTIGSSDSVNIVDDVNSVNAMNDASEEIASANMTDISVGKDSTSEIIQDAGNSKQPDIITITKDVVSTIKDAVANIIADTGTEVFIDMMIETAPQKSEVSGQLDIGGTPEVMNVVDTNTTPDNQAEKDVQVSPADIIQLNDGTTWYTSKAYQYKVQFPSWVEVSQLKTTDLLLSGNSADKIGLTNQQLASTAHFTLRTEFEYYPEYMKYDAWWKNLYGKPDEVETYKGQTFQYHSADSGGGFNRYTYVKIGNVGALRIEMKFSMPEQLYVDGFEQKALEVLNMVTKSAQAVN